MLSVPPDETVPQIFFACRNLGIHIGTEHVRRHGYDFGFVFGDAGPDLGVKGVALGIKRIDFIQKINMLVVAMIYRPRHENRPSIYLPQVISAA